MVSKRFFDFPNPVNETSARLVAGGVVAQAIAFLAIRQWWVLVPLTFGFLARVTTGPRFSPLGLLATRVVTPRLRVEHRFVPGPPKRFAQGIGLVFSTSALVASLAGSTTVAVVVIAGLLGAAGLEAFVGFCCGCVMFKGLMNLGVLPESVCLDCADISSRLEQSLERQAA